MTRRNLVHRGREDFRPPVFKPNSSWRNRWENRLRRFLDLQAGTLWRDLTIELASAKGAILDIGCGAQVYRDLLPSGVSYRGIDTSDALSHFGYALPDVTYFDGDDWRVADASVDVALSTEVLEHVAEPVAFLDQTFRVLRPGGRLILTVPFAARWHFIPFDYWRYTPSSLDRLLSRAGFEAVVVQARGNPLTVACYKVMALPLMLVFGAGQNRPPPWKRALGLLLLPLVVAVAVIANLTIRGDWGDDCLGYTVTARRPHEGGQGLDEAPTPAA